MRCGSDGSGQRARLASTVTAVSHPSVSVIIPARNGEGSLPALLRSLREQTLPSERFEVIVVDNDSSDDTAGIASAFGARVVHEPIANRSRARNRGAEAARSRLYAFTDADCVAHPGWLEALLGSASAAPLVAGDVLIRTSDDPNPIERYERLWRFGQRAWVEQGWAATANLLVDADAFERISGFDPAWRHIGEDADFCLRARDAGYQLAFCGDAVVEHDAERDYRSLLRRFFLHGYSTTQSFHRLGIGHRAWCDPLPALFGDRALRRAGNEPNGFPASEWRRLARLARLGYSARVAGSLWAELSRAR